MARSTCRTALAIMVSVTALSGCSSSSGPVAHDATTGDLGGRDAADARPADAAADVPPPLGCSPGTLIEGRIGEACGFGRCVCYGYAPDGGSLAASTVVTYTLPEPMSAGQPYALSISVMNNGFTGTIELWGTDSDCGPGLEKLYEGPFVTKVHCAKVIPSASYTHVISVEHTTGHNAVSVVNQFTACPTGSCPAQ